MYWEKWVIENKESCEYCWGGFTSANYVTKDHLIPRVESRSYAEETWNLVLSCLNCNQRKGSYINRSIPWIPENRELLIDDVRINKLGQE